MTVERPVMVTGATVDDQRIRVDCEDDFGRFWIEVPVASLMALGWTPPETREGQPFGDMPSGDGAALAWEQASEGQGDGPAETRDEPS